MFRKYMPLPIVVLFCALMLVAGCRKQPVHNFEAQPIPRTTVKLTDAKIRDAIIRAGTANDWQVVPEAGQSLRATTYYRNKHMATVSITYTNQDYSIRYAGSSNFDYDNGMIHTNYNNLVIKLQRAIDAELARIQ